MKSPISVKKIILIIFALFVVSALCYVAYLYQEGDVENYTAPPLPEPVKKEAQVKEQVLQELQVLSQAIDAYYVKNMEYPATLEALVGDFLPQIPQETAAGKTYIYKATGDDYTLSVNDPKIYNMRKLYVENGNIIQE